MKSEKCDDSTVTERWPDKPFILITGMHRSGTSFLSRALNLMGTYLGDFEDLLTDEWRPAKDNPGGHWEHRKFYELGEKILADNSGSWHVPPSKITLNEQLGFQIQQWSLKLANHPSLMSGFKDPRILLYLDSYKKFLPKNIVVVGIFRHPLEVAESLRIRNQFDKSKSLYLWRVYNQNLLNITKKHPGFLLDFNWSKNRLLSEIISMGSKLGLATNVDLESWYTEDFIHNKIDEQSFDPDTQIIYMELKKRSEENSRIRVPFKQEVSFEIIGTLLSDMQKQTRYFKKIYHHDLEELRAKEAWLSTLQNYKKIRTDKKLVTNTLIDKQTIQETFMLDVVVSADKEYTVGGEITSVSPGKKYVASSQVAGITGKPYSALFGITLFDKNNQIIERRIQWLNDFSGAKKTYNIVFVVPDDCVSLRAIYRINNETARKSFCHFKLLPIEDIHIIEADSYMAENYDVLFVSQKIARLSIDEEEALERNITFIFAASKSEATWLGTKLLSYQTKCMYAPLLSEHMGALQGDEKTIRNLTLRSMSQDNFFNPKYGNTLRLHFRRLILNRIYAQFKDVKRKVVVIEHFGFGVDFLVQCLPKSKVILIIKDGRDVVESNIRDIRNGLIQNGRVSDALWHVARESREWVSTVDLFQKTYDKFLSERGLIIKYEDLRENTYKLLKEIYRFIDIPIDDEEIKNIVNNNKFVNLSEIEKVTGSWKENFSRQEIDAMQQIMNSTLQKLGYKSNVVLSSSEESVHQELYDFQQNASSEVYDITEEEKIILEKNLIWIFASPRSGTTWLGTQLLSHETNIMDEPLLGYHLCALIRFPEEYRRYFDEYRNHSDYFFNSEHMQTWKYHLRNLILNRIYAQFKDVNRKLIIKEPNGSMAADIILQCLPNSKAIFLFRDGRDVLDSYVDAIKEGGWLTSAPSVKLTQSSEHNLKIISSYSKRWSVTSELLLLAEARHLKKRGLIIKYEDLRENTYKLLKEIYRFIDIPIDDNELNRIIDLYSFEKIPESQKGRGKRTRAASSGMWKENFSRQEIDAMQQIMNSTLQKLGYAITNSN